MHFLITFVYNYLPHHQIIVKCTLKNIYIDFQNPNVDVWISIFCSFFQGFKDSKHVYSSIITIHEQHKNNE